jgi:hypothetical protein
VPAGCNANAAQSYVHLQYNQVRAALLKLAAICGVGNRLENKDVINNHLIQASYPDQTRCGCSFNGDYQKYLYAFFTYSL